MRKDNLDYDVSFLNNREIEYLLFHNYTIGNVQFAIGFFRRNPHEREKYPELVSALDKMVRHDPRWAWA